MLTRRELESIYSASYPRITQTRGQHYVEQGPGRSFPIHPPDELLLNTYLNDTLSPTQKRDLQIAYMRAYNRYDAGAIKFLEDLLVNAPLPTN